MIRNTLTVSLALLAVALVAPSHAQSKYKQPKNAFGQPDMSGVWSNATTTPFERPTEFGNRIKLTDEEAARVQGTAEKYRAAGDVSTDPKAGAPTDRNTNLGYNRFWTDPGTAVMRVNGEPRSSMITTTPNGRVPPRKQGAPAVNARRATETSELTAGAGRNEGPESRGLSERCVFMQTTAGPVLRPVLYNNNYRLVQGRDSVAIVVEMIHDVRVVRIGGKHRNDGVRQWMGDSIGRYEGNTLVVETVNYHPEQQFYGASEKLKVTERFTRVSDDRLLYQFTVEDPLVWDQPWGGEYEMWASPGIYEYACHEGNHGLYGILAGARAEERRAEKKKQEEAERAKKAGQ
jgi:hypothetical protein